MKINVANFSIRIPDDLLERLNELATKTHRSKSFYVLEALKSHLEDMEDYYLAIERLTDKNAEYLTSKEAEYYLEI
jgi:RHH-type transcriptional regulator, rel operon repressor / antitoxin RelB